VNRLFRLVSLALLASFFLASVGTGVAQADPAWYDQNWNYRKKITIDHTKVSNTDQTNFPVLINRTDPDWKDTSNGGNVAQSDGGDILFTNASGTKLDHEVEDYTPSTGELVAWVEVDLLSASSDTDIYIYYGNAACADQWNTEGTWDPNFKMVQHLQEDPSDPDPAFKDATSNGNDGTDYGSMTSADQITGQIDGSLDFDGTDDYVDCGSDGSLDITDNITIAAWIYIEDYGSSYPRICSKEATTSCESFGLLLWMTSHKLEFLINTGSESPIASAGAIPQDQWVHIAVTFSRPNGIIYINGSENSSGTVDRSIPITTNHLTIGNNNLHSRSFDGIIDEVRISDIARSADWIKTSYNNQSLPSTFYSVGSEQTSLSISNTPNSHDFGSVAEGVSPETGLTNFSVTNNSGVAINITISGVDMTGGITWTLADDGSPGTNICGLKAGLEGGSYDIIVKKNAPYFTLVSGLAGSATQKWGLKLYVPTSFSDGVQKIGIITLTATVA
jgi:hypothetical protein